MSHFPHSFNNAGTYHKRHEKKEKYFPNKARAMLKAIWSGQSKAQDCRYRYGKKKTHPHWMTSDSGMDPPKRIGGLLQEDQI